MTSTTVKDMLRASPFKPFRVHMGNDRALDVPHPEFAWVAPNNREAVISSPEGGLEIVDILMIQSIETLPPRGTKNGKRGRAA